MAFVLAARFRKPLPIFIGILFATLLNHGAAGALGAWVTSVLSHEMLRWILGLSFLAMAVWVMIPGKFEETEAKPARFGVFGTTLLLFVLVEIGDKTQIATIALAAQFQDLVFVVLGTTLGMMIANVPAVIVGEKISHKIPIRLGIPLLRWYSRGPG